MPPSIRSSSLKPFRSCFQGRSHIQNRQFYSTPINRLSTPQSPLPRSSSSSASSASSASSTQHSKRSPQILRAISPATARIAYRKRNITLFNYTLSLLIGTLALSYGSVPLYKTVCQQMGWGGQPVKSRAHFNAGQPGGSTTTTTTSDAVASVRPVADAKRIRVQFTSSVSSSLPWRFTPQQRSVYVRPGETALAFYTATNSGAEDVIGVATYSVSPANVAPYFSKIQCFCFEEQRLLAGESVDMPVFFYVDPAFVEDVATRKIETINLHYTFFKAKYSREEHLNPTKRI